MQHILYFFPLPHGHFSFLFVFIAFPLPAPPLVSLAPPPPPLPSFFTPSQLTFLMRMVTASGMSRRRSNRFMSDFASSADGTIRFPVLGPVWWNNKPESASALFVINICVVGPSSWRTPSFVSHM